MVNDRPVDLFAAKLRPGGEFRLATDDPTYLNWSLMVMQRHSAQFEWLAETPGDFLDPPGGWIETRYGAKSRREGRPALLFALPPRSDPETRHGDRPQDHARRRRPALRRRPDRPRGSGRRLGTDRARI